MTSQKNKDGGWKREVLLMCRHVVLFEPPYPTPGDDVYCRRCVAWHPMLQLVQPYALRCGHCQLSRTYGADLLAAERAAGRHVAENPQAVVTIRKDGMEVCVVRQDEGQTELPLPGHTAEALARAESQRSLTNFIRSLPK
jgi:hypothetical protein